MIDLVLVKKDMLHYVHDVRAVKGMGIGLSDYYSILCKIRLVGMWIRRSKMVNRARKIRSEKLSEHHYMEEYARRLESKNRLG